MLLAVSMADAGRAAPAVQTNLPNVTTVLAPRANFDPMLASDADLAANGFPPRPDERVSPGAFASWKRATTSHAVRVLPVLRRTSIRHGPAMNSRVVGNTALSSNWSGYALTNSASSYSASSFDVVTGNFVVPVAQQAIGACDGTVDYSSSWIGIDGTGSSDVLQAGTEADAYCSGSTTQTYYGAWYEWYPDNEVAVDNFAVSPGNDVYVEVWSTGATTGNAYMINYTTNQSFNIAFSSPAGTALIGNSAEWVVERPTVNNVLPTLTNYIQDFFTETYVSDFSNQLSEPGAPVAGVTSTPFQMYGNDSTDIISYPILLGSSAIWMRDGGSVY